MSFQGGENLVASNAPVPAVAGGEGNKGEDAGAAAGGGDQPLSKSELKRIAKEKQIAEKKAAKAAEKAAKAAAAAQ